VTNVARGTPSAIDDTLFDMASLRRHSLHALTFLVTACGSDPTPAGADFTGDASISADAPRDRAMSSDAVLWDGSEVPEASNTVDGARDTDSSMTRDASFDETSIIADAITEAHDGVPIPSDQGDDRPSIDADGALPPTHDGAIDDSPPPIVDSGVEAGADGVRDTPSDDVAPDGSVVDANEAGGLDATSDPSGADGDGTSASGFPGSILVDTTEGAMINGWVGAPTQLWKLCYTTAIHTRSGAAFHANCDYKGESVSIARVSYAGNARVIGGYNSGSWTSPATGTYRNNSGSFLFSVTNAFKHAFPGSSTVPYYTFDNQYYGPTFGAGNDWYVHSQMTFGTCRPGYTYQCRVDAVDTATCNADFCGTSTSSDYYTLEELEVWVK
jgi:hypothetical protein